MEIELEPPYRRANGVPPIAMGNDDETATGDAGKDGEIRQLKRELPGQTRSGTSSETITYVAKGAK